MLLRALFAILLVLAPLGAHCSDESSAVTFGAQTNSNDALSASTLSAARSRELLATKKKRPSKKKPNKKSPPKRKPSPPPRKPSPKPDDTPKLSPPKRSPSPTNTPTVVPSPPLPPSPSPSPSPSPPPPPACPLTIGGTTTTFQTCDSTTWADIGTLYFSLEGETLTIGYKGTSASQGWVGVTITPNFKMAGSDAVVAAGQSDGTVKPVVVHIDGYSPSAFGPTAVYSDVVVGKAGDLLAATAMVKWPAGQTELPLAFTAGSVSPTGSIQKHYKYPMIKKISRTTLSVVA